MSRCKPSLPAPGLPFRTVTGSGFVSGPVFPNQVIRCNMSIDDLSIRLERVESLLQKLYEREIVREWYTIEEFARQVGKSEFTCREWCRLGRIHAAKRQSGRGAYSEWVVSHRELERYRRDGLLPLPIRR